MKRKNKRFDDIADDVINKSESIEHLLNEFDLEHNLYMQFEGQDYLRTYTEGGTTSYNYKGRLTCNLRIDIEEEILSTLEEKRALLLQDDVKRKTQMSIKKKQL